MKRCPQCGRDYNDDSMSYCLDDGSELLFGPAAAEEARTKILPSDVVSGVSDQTAPTASLVTSKSRFSGLLQNRRNAVLLLTTVMIACVAVICVVYFRSGPSITSRSLMVLPLKNLGGDPQDDYLSDGITDELITKISKLKTVRVISPSVSMRYKNSAKDAAEIGRELNVESVIEGTVRKQGTRFRVSIHLVNAKDGFEVWSDNDFENEIGDLLNAETQIAQAIANRLKGQLTAQERGLFSIGSTANAEAYELFLRGKQEYRKKEPQLARNLFDRAIEIDPAFADAYAWRGRAVYSQFKIGSGDRTTLDAALSDANHALQIDPNLITARRTLISIYHSTGQTEEGLKQAKMARETNADDFDAVEGSALAYFRAGMIDKAISFYQQALAFDPDDEEIRTSLSRCYWNAGEYQKGIDVLEPMLLRNQGGWWIAMLNYSALGNVEKAIEIGNDIPAKDPDNISFWLDYGSLLKAVGKPDQARSIWLEAARRSEAKVAIYENQRTRIWLGFLYAHLGDREKALTQISKALAIQPDDSWTLFQAGSIRAVLNDRPAAVDYIKQAIDRGWLGIHYVDQSEDLANLREDASFQELRSSLRKKVDDLEKIY